MKDFLNRHLAHPGIKRSTFLRRALAIALIILGISLQLARSANTTQDVVVFTTDIAPGTKISADHLTKKAFPPSAIPHHAIESIEEILGATAVSAQPEGSIVTTFSAASAEFLELTVNKITSNIHSDEINLVPIKLSDPTIATLLRQGDTVTIVSTGQSDHEKEIIAAGGVVVFTTSSSEDKSSTSPGTVMLALPPADAETVAAKSLTSPLTVVVTGN